MSKSQIIGGRRASREDGRRYLLRSFRGRAAASGRKTLRPLRPASAPDAPGKVDPQDRSDGGDDESSCEASEGLAEIPAQRAEKRGQKEHEEFHRTFRRVLKQGSSGPSVDAGPRTRGKSRLLQCSGMTRHARPVWPALGAKVAELADALVLGTSGDPPMRVRVSPFAPTACAARREGRRPRVMRASGGLSTSPSTRHRYVHQR